MEVLRDIPWQMWLYLAIGLPIAWWYQARDKHPEKDYDGRTQFFVLFILAWMWPVLLLALLANRPDKDERKGKD
jgi:hypothetical protein